MIRDADIFVTTHDDGMLVVGDRDDADATLTLSCDCFSTLAVLVCWG